jgi:predicted permease
VALLGGSVGLVLLIACANIGNLLLAAAEERRRELAVRAALGSGGGRIARLIFAESAVLAGAGALLGLALAPLAIRALLALYPGGLPRGDEVTINGTVLTLALAATALATFAAGLPPLMEARRLDLQKNLRAGERGAVGPAARRVRAVLVTAQVALSVALLVGGGLMVRTFAALERAEPGFDDDSLLTFNLGMSSVRYPEAADEAAFLESLLERIRAMPGVAAAGSSSLLPLTPGDFLDGFRREGYDDGFPDYPTARLHNVSSGFIETLGLPLVAGRTLTAADDAGAQRVVVVNETFARRWFPEGALGRRIHLQSELREIVGMVGDKRHHGLREEPDADLWVPRAQIANPRLLAWIAVRSAGDPLALVPPIRAALTELDPSIAIADPRTMSDRLDAALRPNASEPGSSAPLPPWRRRSRSWESTACSRTRWPAGGGRSGSGSRSGDRLGGWWERRWRARWRPRPWASRSAWESRSPPGGSSPRSCPRWARGTRSPSWSCRPCCWELRRWPPWVRRGGPVGWIRRWRYGRTEAADGARLNPRGEVDGPARVERPARRW